MTACAEEKANRMPKALTPSQVRPLSMLCACALALLLVCAPAASADGPDFSLSRVDCAPIDASLRPGEQLRCELNVALIRSDQMVTDGITADMTLPADTTFDPMGVDNFHATPAPGDPTRILFDASRLGRMFDGESKRVGATFTIKPTAIPDGPLQTVVRIHAPGWPDATVTSNLLKVTRPPADLSPSSLPCVDANAGKLLLGDRVDCTLKLGNLPLHEDATAVSVQLPLLPRTQAAGGDYSFITGSTLNWVNKVPGGVPSGTPGSGPTVPDLHFSFVVGDDMPGGTVLVPQARVNYQNPSTPGVVELFTVSTSNSLVTTPGVGNLTGSTLGCRDLDGAPTYPGETLACLLTVATAAGREDVADVSATLPVPLGTRAALGAATTFAVGTDVLGLMPAGTSKAYEYRVVVNDVPAGTRITPTGTLLGTSTPSGVAISRPLAGTALVTSVRSGAATGGGGAAGVSATPAGVVAAAAKPAARGPAICGSRRTVTVNVKPPEGKRWKSVTFTYAKKTVTGKKAAGSRGRKGYFTAKLVFQGLPKGPLKVAVKGVTTKGKTVRSTRTYNLCAKK
jgi:hypothetical protein